MRSRTNSDVLKLLDDNVLMHVANRAECYERSRVPASQGPDCRRLAARVTLWRDADCFDLAAQQLPAKRGVKFFVAL